MQYHRHLPKPPFPHHGHHHHQLVEGAENVCLSDDASLSEELCLTEELWHVDSAINQIIDAHASVHRNDLPAGGLDEQQHCHLISTHSPPIINLSPNLSPSSDHHRTSPVYDLRESTRRRSTQGGYSSKNSGVICVWGGKEESVKQTIFFSVLFHNSVCIHYTCHTCILHPLTSVLIIDH